MKNFLWAAIASLMLWNCAGHEMSANKYNAILETLRASMLAENTLVSMYLASPPGAFTVPLADILTPCPALGLRTDDTDADRFLINDIPIIKSAGLFSSVADGLAPNNTFGLVRWRIALQGINNGGVVKGTVITFTFDESNLNRLTDYDVAAQTIAAIQLQLPTIIAAGATFLKFDVSVESDLHFAAYSMAPGWAAAHLQLTPQILVEHTFPMTDAP